MPAPFRRKRYDPHRIHLPTHLPDESERRDGLPRVPRLQPPPGLHPLHRPVSKTNAARQNRPQVYVAYCGQLWSSLPKRILSLHYGPDKVKRVFAVISWHFP